MMEQFAAAPAEKKRAVPEGMPRPVWWLVQAIDTFTDWTGKAFAWLILPLVVIVSYEVFSRYLFGAPTIWAYDLTYMLYGSIFMLGVGFTLLRKSHIRTDLFYNNWSPRVQGLVDCLVYLFFLPALALLLWAGWEMLEFAWRINERSGASPWRPTLVPFRAVIPLAIALLMLQSLSELIKAAYAVAKGRWP